MPRYYRPLTETVRAFVVRGDLRTYKLRPTVERGLSIYRIAGLWYVGRDLSAETELAADRLYRGGYVYNVPDEELAAMEAQGIHASYAVDVFLDNFTETF